MLKGIIGKKIGMTRIFIEEGVAVPVTVIQAGPCTVIQKKTEDKDGYEALQLGFGTKKKVNRPMSGHFQAAGGGNFATLKEFSADDIDGLEPGAEVTMDIFQIGEKIDVTGLTKGRGFAGVIKRHGFGGGRATHGCTTHRSPGSIGAAAYPSRVFPGKKMPGRMGARKQTVRNLEIVDIREEYGVILIKGAVPGPRQGVVFLKKTGGN
ncbi:MAG: 50S ribosomal protein L3 [Proteobacteria bacterium]|nr:50S ribosomal protein L3 [Pseudomonadota bacterium]